MVQQATVSGGMLPKLRSLHQRVEKRCDAGADPAGDVRRVLPGFFTQPIDCGTEVICSN